MRGEAHSRRLLPLAVPVLGGYLLGPSSEGFRHILQNRLPTVSMHGAVVVAQRGGIICIDPAFRW